MAQGPFRLAFLRLPCLEVVCSTVYKSMVQLLHCLYVEVNTFHCGVLLTGSPPAGSLKTHMQCRPYFLPCAATSLIAALAAASSICLMHETLPSIVQKRQQGQSQHRLAGDPFFCVLFFHSSPGPSLKAQYSKAGVKGCHSLIVIGHDITDRCGPGQSIMAAKRASSHPCL